MCDFVSTRSWFETESRLHEKHAGEANTKGTKATEEVTKFYKKNSIAASPLPLIPQDHLPILLCELFRCLRDLRVRSFPGHFFFFANFTFCSSSSLRELSALWLTDSVTSSTANL